MSGWNGSCEDWLHGDECYTDTQELPDADAYEPMQKWEIDAAIESLKAKAMYHAGANHD
tara:strand:- start:76 stop:252 length:177 start_codon:yes stop_codon:yes gene_type:complete